MTAKMDPKKVPAMTLLGAVLMNGAPKPMDEDDCVSVCQWCCGAGCQSCGWTGRGDTHPKGCDCVGCTR